MKYIKDIMDIFKVILYSGVGGSLVIVDLELDSVYKCLMIIMM